MYNSKFTVAIHLLTLIACNNHSEDCNSEEAATSVNTNPVVVRRILGTLREKGIVTSKSGRGGGWQLAKKPEDITLGEVYSILEENGPMFAMHTHKPNGSCLVGKNISVTLSKHYAQAEKAMLKELSLITISAILKDIQKINNT